MLWGDIVFKVLCHEIISAILNCNERFLIEMWSPLLDDLPGELTLLVLRANASYNCHIQSEVVSLSFIMLLFIAVIARLRVLSQLHVALYCCEMVKLVMVKT